jgi:hypothetical protein
VLQRLLRFQIRDWALPIAICVTLVALHAMGDQTVQTLRYERGAVLAGETWRLVTAHLVHADLAHLAWNVLGVVLVWWLFTDEYSAVDWLLIMAPGDPGESIRATVRWPSGLSQVFELGQRRAARIDAAQAAGCSERTSLAT